MASVTRISRAVVVKEKGRFRKNLVFEVVIKNVPCVMDSDMTVIINAPVPMVTEELEVVGILS